MIRCCFKHFMHQHHDSPIGQLIEHIHGNCGLVFVKDDLAHVREVILSHKVPAPARIGVHAPIEVIVPAGPTGCDPSQTNWFQALNIPTKIVKGQIEIANPVSLIQPGEKVTPGQAALLDKLNIRPFSYGVVIALVYDNGSMYDPKVLDLTEADIISYFFNAVSKVAAVSLEIGYPTLASLPHSINNAFKKLIAVVANEGIDYTFPKAEPFLAYLADPSAFAAAAAPAAAASTEAAPAAAEEEEEEEEEDMGAGGLFGDDDDDW